MLHKKNLYGNGMKNFFDLYICVYLWINLDLFSIYHLSKKSLLFIKYVTLNLLLYNSTLFKQFVCLFKFKLKLNMSHLLYLYIMNTLLVYLSVCILLTLKRRKKIGPNIFPGNLMTPDLWMYKSKIFCLSIY